MEMMADVKQTLLEDRKRSGRPERLYRRWPSPGLWRRKGGGGMEWSKLGHRPGGRGREAAARANHPRHFAPF
jgi:hypothetical protein